MKTCLVGGHRHVVMHTVKTRHSICALVHNSAASASSDERKVNEEVAATTSGTHSKSNALTSIIQRRSCYQELYGISRGYLSEDTILSAVDLTDHFYF